jgi:hypothetical protein
MNRGGSVHPSKSLETIILIVRRRHAKFPVLKDIPYILILYDSPCRRGPERKDTRHWTLSILLTDAEIAAFISEPKQLPAGFLSKVQLRPKQGHKERDLEITGANGSEFRLILRQSLFNILDFSAILAYADKSSSQAFRLRRYNGKSHEHTNKIEHQTIYGFHIHFATERYQHSGFREDAYAELTNRYGDFQGALSCLIQDCGLVFPSNGQELLF